MLRTIHLSPIGRLALALAVLLALIAAGALATARGSNARARGAAPLLGAAPVLAQGIVPPPAPGGGGAAGIAVSGDGEATATPDVAYVSLGVQSDGKTAREAMDANSTSMTAVLDAVRRAGVADNDIRTTGVSLTPLMSQPRPGDQSPPQVIGYRATNGVSVTVRSAPLTGAVLDVAVAAGANTAGGVRFGILDDDGLRRRALEAAGREARAKADAIAAGLGLRVTGVQSVVEQGSAAPQPRELQPLAAARADQGAAPPPPIQPGELTVRARVQVVFSFA